MKENFKKKEEKKVVEICAFNMLKRKIPRFKEFIEEFSCLYE